VPSSSACRPTATQSRHRSSRNPHWQIITALGAEAPNAVGLVYIATFGLDEGESISALLAQGGPPVEGQFAKRMGAATIAPASGHLAMVFHPDEVVQLIMAVTEAVPRGLTVRAA